MVGTGAEHLTQGSPFPSDLWVTAKESGLPKDTVFLGMQIRALDHDRLASKAGMLPKRRFPELCEVVRYLIGDERT
jgi:mRNA interferase MazF